MYFVEKVKKVSSTDLDNTVQEAQFDILLGFIGQSYLSQQMLR